MLLCQNLSALDEMTALNNQLCSHQKSFNKRLDVETHARKCLEKDMTKMRTKVKDIESNNQNISTWITKSSDNMKSDFTQNIAIYDADKNGKPDYALETAGGKIVGTRNTDTFTLEEPTYFLGVIPLCQEYNMPSTIINPSVYPGECWAFEGSQGSVVIQLLGRVQISGVSMEHISNLLAPTGDISTAPKHFSIWGLTDPDEQEGFFFGNFQYENNGVPLQYFDTVHLSPRQFNYVELKVHSNHGNPEYTCIYRVRIHGKMDNN